MEESCSSGVTLAGSLVTSGPEYEYRIEHEVQDVSEMIPLEIDEYKGYPDLVSVLLDTIKV